MNLMYDQLSAGGRLSEALVRSPIVSPSIGQAVSTGEESGHLDHHPVLATHKQRCFLTLRAEVHLWRKKV